MKKVMFHGQYYIVPDWVLFIAIYGDKVYGLSKRPKDMKTYPQWYADPQTEVVFLGLINILEIVHSELV